MASGTITVSIDCEELKNILLHAKRPDRLDELLAKYGETCTLTDAGKIIGCGRTKVNDAVQDGRIKLACAGTRVDVRSIAAYIEDTGKADHTARMERKRMRSTTLRV